MDLRGEPANTTLLEQLTPNCILNPQVSVALVSIRRYFHRRRRPSQKTTADQNPATTNIPTTQLLYPLRLREHQRRRERKIVRARDQEICFEIVSPGNDLEASSPMTLKKIWVPKQDQTISTHMLMRKREHSWRATPDTLLTTAERERIRIRFSQGWAPLLAIQH